MSLRNLNRKFYSKAIISRQSIKQVYIKRKQLQQYNDLYKLYTLDATVYATPYCNKIMTTDTQIFKVYKDNTPSRKSQQKIWQAIKPAFTHNVYFSLKKTQIQHKK